MQLQKLVSEMIPAKMVR